MTTKQTPYSVAFSFSLDNKTLYIYGITGSIDNTFIYISDNGAIGYAHAYSIDIPSLREFKSSDIPFLVKGFILNGNNINIALTDYLNYILYGKVSMLAETLRTKLVQLPIPVPMGMLDYNEYYRLQTQTTVYQYLVHHINSSSNNIEYYIYTSTTELPNNMFMAITDKIYYENINKLVYNPKTNSKVKALIKIANPSFKKKGGIYAFRLADKYKTILNMPHNISLFYNRMNGLVNVLNMFNLAEHGKEQLTTARTVTVDTYYHSYQFTIV